MPGVISREDGRIISMPDFSKADKEAMAKAIAKAMVQMARADIARAAMEIKGGQCSG